MATPSGVVAFGEIAAEVDAAGFLAGQRRPDHQAGNREQILKFPPGRRIELPAEYVPPPKLHVSLSVQEAVAVAQNTHLANHEASQRIGNVRHVERPARFRVETRVQGGRGECVGLSRCGVGRAPAASRAKDEPLQEAVGR